jgi:hypothetical protein
LREENRLRVFENEVDNYIWIKRKEITTRKKINWGIHNFHSLANITGNKIKDDRIGGLSSTHGRDKTH